MQGGHIVVNKYNFSILRNLRSFYSQQGEKMTLHFKMNGNTKCIYVHV